MKVLIALALLISLATTSASKPGDLYISISLTISEHGRDSSSTKTTFTISGNTATFSGTCTNNSAPCTFNVTVQDQDNDQPEGPDSFIISINGGPPEGGTLRGGDIEIH